MVVVGVGPARADDTRQIHWVGSLEKALKDAGIRKAPVLVAVNNRYDNRTEKEKYDANQRMATTCYRDPGVVKISRNYVCVLAGNHPKPVDVLDETEICRHFGRISYRSLKSVTAAVREKYFKGQGVIVSPQHLILDAEGRILHRFYLERKPKEFAHILTDSLARFRGDAPARRAGEDVDSVVKALKGKNEAARMEAFKKALEILSADKDNRKVKEAASIYLKSRKDYLKSLDCLAAITAAGTEGALSLLVPYMGHKKPRMRRGVLEVFARSAPYKDFLKPVSKRAKVEKVEAPLRSLIKVLDRYSLAFKEALTHLNKLVTHKQPPIKVLATLAAARPDNKAIYKKLLARARKKGDLLVRSAAILGLARMRAKEALPILLKVRKSEKKNPALVQVLDTAIDLLGGTPGDETDEVNVAALDMEINRIKREALSTGRGGDRGSVGRDGRGAGGRGGRSGSGSDGR